MSEQGLGALIGACLLALPVAMGGSLVAKAGDYRLEPGDLLSLMVVGAPELTRPIPVEMDGTAFFPLVGALPAAGSTLGELRGTVGQAYAATILPRTAGGEAAPALIRPAQVSLTIAEYGPVYLTGALVQPRAIAFRPGLTLRQVLALAGSAAAMPETNPIAARAALEAALVDLARANARIWSLKQALGKDAPEDYQRILVADLPAIREIAGLERSMAEARIAERAAEKAKLAENILRAQKRLSALEAQKANEQEGSALDQKIASEVRDLFTRGSPLAPAAKLAEVQRSALVSASRVLELEVAAENVRTELADLRAQEATAEDGDRSAIWTELADALTLAQDKRARLTALQTASAGIAEADLSAVVTRAGLPLAPDAGAGGDLPLQPGDIIEITAAPQHDPEG